MNCVYVGCQTRGVYRAGKGGQAFAVHHHIAQSTVFRRCDHGVFANHTCERHMACACVDCQILRQMAIGVDDCFVERHVAVVCLQLSGMVRVTQLHQLSVMLLTTGADAATLNHHSATQGRRVYTTHIGLQAGGVHRAFDGGHAFAVDHHIAQGIACGTHHAHKGHIAATCLDCQRLSCGCEVLHKTTEIHSGICCRQRGALQRAIQQHIAAKPLRASGSHTPTFDAQCAAHLCIDADSIHGAGESHRACVGRNQRTDCAVACQ